jgi:hypothetical protein
MTHDAGSNTDTAWVSEEDAHRLLARAAELDARGPSSVRLTQLRESARDAGISPEAFAQALADLRTGNLSPKSVGQAVAARLARYRRQAFAVAYLAAAFITPGDVIAQTVTLTLALFGAYEGVMLLARWLGRQPRRPTPFRMTAASESKDNPASPRTDKTSLPFRVLALRRT